MRIVSIIFYLLLILFGVTFAVLNAGSVQLNLYVRQLSLPISVLVVMLLAIGFFVGFLSTVVRYLRQKREIKQLTSKLAMAEKEIKNLRSIPLNDKH